jgi:hypothetical protein
VRVVVAISGANALFAAGRAVAIISAGSAQAAERAEGVIVVAASRVRDQQQTPQGKEAAHGAP